MKRYKEKASDLLRCCTSSTSSSKSRSVASSAMPDAIGVATKVTFTVNGRTVVVRSSEIPSNLSLAEYLRKHLHLTGTKVSCNQAGCGSCAVTLAYKESEDLPEKIRSVNACITPVLGCDGYDITTIEGLGNTRDGLGQVQSRLAAMFGTQCGFCSPGMVMAMDSLKRASDNQPDLATIENILDGNICRCTGYRPILDAFKSLAVDAPEDLKKKVADIEDFNGSACNGSLACKAENGTCGQGKCSVVGKSDIVLDTLKAASGPDWIRPRNLDAVLKALRNLPAEAKYRIVAGNTSIGVYRDPLDLSAYISIDKVKELRTYSLEPLTFGAAMTLTDTIEIFDEMDQPEYAYVHQMAKHLRKLGNIHVRNSGTLAGNLMMKHQHKDFPSDLFVLLEAAGAIIVTQSSVSDSAPERATPLEWLQSDMERKLIVKIELPKMEANHVFISYKIAPRQQNAHAYINAAFKVKINPETSVIEERPTFVFGGVSSEFHRAKETEAFLVGSNINKKDVFRKTFQIISVEANPDSNPVSASPEYRKYLVQALLYKGIIKCLGNKVSPELRSAGAQLTRERSSGYQYYPTDPEMYPISQPIPKIESKAQCSGETLYIDDLPSAPNELYGAFVLSDIASAELDVVDTTEALVMPGVYAYISHEDIPGDNNAALIGRFRELIFAFQYVHYAGQAIGLILAETQALALAGAKAVKVSYKNHKKPILTIADALKYPNEGGVPVTRDSPEGEQVPNLTIYENEVLTVGDQSAFDETDEPDEVVVKGEFEIGTQHHIHLEQHSCIVRPIDEGQYEIESATQWIQGVQNVVARALGIQNNAIDLKVRRLGGAYGGKICNPNQVACAAAVAAHKVQRPVRIVLDMETNLRLMGKRLPYLTKYTAKMTQEGKLKAIGMKIYCDCGYRFNQPTVSSAARFAQNCYHSENWNIVPGAVVTNTAANTYVRAPGTTQGHAIIENIMEHCALAMGTDPLEFRLKNLIQPDSKLLDGSQVSESESETVRRVIEQARHNSKYDLRVHEIEKHNRENRWTKRGLSLVPVRYLHSYKWTKMHCNISIYSKDGTVAVSHGGIEMGQGLNTKVAQVVAKELGVEMSLIRVKAATNLMSPNNALTGGSTGTEGACNAALKAARDLKERIDAVKPDKENPTWLDLVQSASGKGVDLASRKFYQPDAQTKSDYIVWAAAVIEVEVDVLTGELNIRRADLVEDTGLATSPEVDVGQVEGGYVMGLGLWTSEHVKYEKDTGRILNFDTWEYKPPSSHDIPADLRTTFIGALDKDPATFLGGKAVGEPCVHMSVGVLFAIRQALNAAKKEAGIDVTKWYNLDGPATVERIQQATGIGTELFTL